MEDTKIVSVTLTLNFDLKVPAKWKGQKLEREIKEGMNWTVSEADEDNLQIDGSIDEDWEIEDPTEEDD